MTTKAFATLLLLAALLLASLSLAPADAPVAGTTPNAVLVAAPAPSPSPAAPAPVPTTAEAGASLALAAGAVTAAVPRKHRRTVFTLIGGSGYCVDEVRPSSAVREDEHSAFADESGEEYLQRIVHLVDEDGDSDPEILFGMLWHLQYDLGIAWGTKAYEDGYFEYQTRAYELTQISDNEYILEYVVDGELLLGGDGSDEYYHAVCKIVIDGNRLTLYEYPSDPDDKYVILEVE